MTRSARANARLTQSGRARLRQTPRVEDGVWAIAEHGDLPDTPEGRVEGIRLAPLTNRMLALYEISFRTVEASSAPPAGMMVAHVVRAESVGHIASQGMYPQRGKKHGLPGLCTASIRTMADAALRNAARKRLAEEAVARVLTLLSVNELVKVLSAKAPANIHAKYRDPLSRLRELAMLEVCRRTPTGPLDGGETQLTLFGL